MAEFNSAEKMIIENVEILPSSVMTGDRNQQRYLYYQLQMSMRKAKRIDIIVSFLILPLIILITS